MKTSHCLLLVAASFVVGLQVNGGTQSANAQAQPTAKPIGRFQISSWSHPAAPGSASGYGCYVLDTSTGEVWSKLGTQESSQRQKRD